MTLGPSEPADEALPASRRGSWHQLRALAAVGAVATGGGAWLVAVGEEVENTGRHAGIPESWNPWIGALCALFGVVGLLIVGVLATRIRRSDVPAVRFDRAHVTIDMPLRRRGSVVDRRSVILVQLVQASQPARFLGFRSIIRICTHGDGTVTVPPTYEGEPEDLARDIAEWASVRLSPVTRDGRPPD